MTKATRKPAKSAAAKTLSAEINKRAALGRQLSEYRGKLDAAETTTDRAIYAENVKYYRAAHARQVRLVDALLAAAEPAGLFPDAAAVLPAPAPAPVKSASLQEVLRAPPAHAPARYIEPAAYAAGSMQARVVDKAAAELRAIYAASPARGPHACYQTACAEGVIASLEIADALTDDREAAIARAIFLRALPTEAAAHRPTAVGALAQMQMLAIDAARKVRLLFSVQQDLLAA